LITIVDLGNIEVIDTSICQHLLDIGVTMQTLGVKVMFCSIKSIVAQTMTKAGIRFTDFDVYKNLEVALNAVYAETGFKLIKTQD
jgi:anti-anti-sigma regulatory factor